jgi:D-alanyl-D-alanine carboxypeptidase
MARARPFLSACIGILAALTACSARAEPSLPEKVQTTLQTWLAERAPIEKVTGIAAYVSLGDPGPAIEAFAGTVRQTPSDAPVSQDTLFHMGSTSKSFTAAVILKLEAAGKLSLDDTIGRWLPQYPAWQNVTIRRLLNMTSGIPTYDAESVFMKDYAAHPAAFFSQQRLVSYVTRAPRKPGYTYSNTNYVLAEMIIEKATGDSYAHQLYRRILQPLNLRDLYYREHLYPPRVTAREPAGYFFLDQARPLAPLLGRDLSRNSLSWARSAGGIVGTLSQMTAWDRALYSGVLLPARQQAELLSLVSTTTGKPIQSTSPNESGFGLGVQQGTNDKFGTHWAYKGGTFGFRTLHVYLPASGLVIAVSLNSFPSDDQIGALMASLYDTLATHGVR